MSETKNMNLVIKISLIIFIINKVFAENSLTKSASYRLQDNLFNGYHSDIRPVKSQNTVTLIQTDFTLMQVISMDDNQETITLSGYLNLGWTDEGMQWKPSEIDNITDINVPITKIWTPDIFLYNAANQDSWNQWSTSYISVNVKPNGSAFCTPPAVTTTVCKLNVEFFPFDEKNCLMKFGSWMYTEKYIIQKSSGNVNIKKYLENSAWTLMEATQTITREVYDDQGSFYSMMNVKLNFRRRTLFFSFNFIIPSLIITVCSIFGFILPPESGEKAGLQITNLLGVLFFTQYVSTIVPQSSLGVPKLSIYLLSVGLLCMLSLIGNIIVLNLHNKDIRIENDMPNWVFFNFLGRLLWMKKVQSKKTSTENIFPSDFVPETIIETKGKNSDLKCLENIEKTLNNIWNDINEKQLEEERELKWKYAAIVMDRFFFILTTIYFIITFSSFVLTIQNFYKPI